MATYYPSSSAEIDVLSATYIRDSKFASYAELPLLDGNMMIYLNPASSAGSIPDISSVTSMPARNCDEFRSIASRNEVMFIPPTGGDPMGMQTINRELNTATSDTAATYVPGELQLNSRSQLRMVDGEQNSQGLSLSLSTQIPIAVPTTPFRYTYPNAGLSSMLSSHLPLPAENGCRPVTFKIDESSQSKDLRNSEYVPYDIQGGGGNSIRFRALTNLQESADPDGVNCNPYGYEQADIANTILKSNYLKATQQLLDEVVNIQDALKQPESGNEQSMNKVEEAFQESKGKPIPASGAHVSATGSSHELSAAERHDLQNKLDKLLSMLDEVDISYKQYYHQMQILVSSFDMVAGCGAAKPYIGLALKTISRHFRCLRDAIICQIQVTRRSLGDQDPSINGQGGAIPRLRYVDQQLRQQRVLQFGMMRHSWRPQRGLPETAVSVLRAWLFEHFLNPYPNDSEKIMLARQTGLTKSQVANWFINARVRLWKPMVEEMYKEEFGDAYMNSTSSPENAHKAAGEKSWPSEDQREELLESETSMTADDQQSAQHHDSRTDASCNREMNGSKERGEPQISAHGDAAKNYGFIRLPNGEKYGSISPDQNGEGSLMFATGAYPVPELASFTIDNPVSLALGLHNGTMEASTVGAGTSEYPYLDPVNQQHRFGTSHLLNDFVS
ncbi:hypothetical protein Nepgr_015746 [Nepenthes gracilis]|uniref:Homeobox domain-containing protein n=1 Tax=Nepenthes gracilis TaxID=150966 RepID=A0AAD3XRW4_NEPGR|nr:hypothetical protein Nepgr_015746 [Nepenthes gracilis]